MTTLGRTLTATAIGALCAVSAMAGGRTLKSNDSQSVVVNVEALHPYTHVADIPAGSDLSTVRFENVKMVRVATETKSTVDVHACEEAANLEPGSSMYCPYNQFQSPAPAYRVTYSYLGQPIGSDEYGSGYFTFSVYLRADEISPTLWKRMSDRRMAKADVAGFFELTTYRVSAPQVVIDQAASTFCEGNFVDGLWTHSDSRCEDKVNSMTVNAPSSYVTVKVDLSAPASRPDSGE
jgi:hypothetical protein